MKILKELMLVHGVSGRESRVADKIAEMMTPYVDSITRDALGNLICYKKGSAKNAKKLMLAGHMDEIGFIVTGVDDKGYIRVSSIGGIHYVSAAYSAVRFENGLRGVIVPEGDFNNNFSSSKFVIDIGAKSKKETERRVKVGDFASTVSHVEHLSGEYWAGRPFDDRIGCAIMVRAAMEMKDCKNDAYFVFTTQEEVGCRGSKTASFAVAPDFSLAFDVTGSGDGPKASPMAVSLGKGAAIKVKDSSVICDGGFVRFLDELAKEKKIPAQLEILEGGGTDTCSMQTAGCGSRATALSVPTRYIHSNNETISKKDYDACVALTAALLERDLGKERF
ncbi:MAG: M20/M25/M40 family metallo-hydrolase [Clostridia bacterium]|nr:M20/M25/M40 family metallo-hydrolase [Clostridia bacterium]